VLFLDHRMRELEVHNITKWEPESVRDLLVSRGFPEEDITADHPGFKRTQEHFDKLKSQMSEEEYNKVMEEMEELMAEHKEEPKKEKNPNDTEVFFDPDEKEKYDNYEETKKIAMAEK